MKKYLKWIPILFISNFIFIGSAAPIPKLLFNDQTKPDILIANNSNKLNNKISFDLTTPKVRGHDIYNDGDIKLGNYKKWMEKEEAADSIFSDLRGNIHAPLSKDTITTVYGNSYYFNFIENEEQGFLNIVATPIDDASSLFLSLKTSFTKVSAAIYIGEFLVVSGNVKDNNLSSLGIYQVDSHLNSLKMIVDPNSLNGVMYHQSFAHLNGGIESIGLAPISSNGYEMTNELIAFPIGMTLRTLSSSILKDGFLKIKINSNGQITKTMLRYKNPNVLLEEQNDSIRAITPISIGNNEGTVLIITTAGTKTINELILPEIKMNIFPTYVQVYTPKTEINQIDWQRVAQYKMVKVDRDGDFQMLWIFQNYLYDSTTDQYDGRDSAILTATFKSREKQLVLPKSISLMEGMIVDEAGTVSKSAMVPTQISYSHDSGDFNNVEKPFLISIQFNGGFQTEKKDLHKKLFTGVIRWSNSDKAEWKVENFVDTNYQLEHIFIHNQISSLDFNRNSDFMAVINNGVYSGVGMIKKDNFIQSNTPYFGGTLYSLRKEATKNENNFYNTNNWHTKIDYKNIVLSKEEELPSWTYIKNHNNILWDLYANPYFENMLNDHKTYKSNVISLEKNNFNMTQKINFIVDYNGGFFIGGAWMSPFMGNFEFNLLKNPGDVSKIPFHVNKDNSNFKLNTSLHKINLERFNYSGNFDDIKTLIGYKNTDLVQFDEALFNSLVNVESIVDDFKGKMNLKLTFMDSQSNFFTKEISITGFLNKFFIIPIIIVPIMVVIVANILLIIFLIKKNKRKEYIAKKHGWNLSNKGSISLTKWKAPPFKIPTNINGDSNRIIKQPLKKINNSSNTIIKQPD